MPDFDAPSPPRGEHHAPGLTKRGRATPTGGFSVTFAVLVVWVVVWLVVRVVVRVVVGVVVVVTPTGHDFKIFLTRPNSLESIVSFQRALIETQLVR